MTATKRYLLGHLVRNAGRIVAGNELLKTVSAKNIGTLGCYISYLRKKIEIDRALPRVTVTHHRSGYSFTAKEGTLRGFGERHDLNLTLDMVHASTFGHDLIEILRDPLASTSEHPSHRLAL